MTSKTVNIVAAFMLMACAPQRTEVGSCSAVLTAINARGIDRISIIAERSGESGYAIELPDCGYYLPISMNSVPRDQIDEVNRQVIALLDSHPREMGVGHFEAECDCDYDKSANVVIARSVRIDRIIDTAAEK